MSTLDDEPRPLDAVLHALDLRPAGEDSFEGDSLPQLHGRVYGGQVLAQAIVAAERTLQDGLADRLIHSLHGYFLRPGDLEEPITFAVERLRDGGSFSARRTHALQRGKPILSMIASFQVVQEGSSTRSRCRTCPGRRSCRARSRCSNGPTTPSLSSSTAAAPSTSATWVTRCSSRQRRTASRCRRSGCARAARCRVGSPSSARCWRSPATR